MYGYSGYSAAKFALRGMAEVLAQELCPFGIRVSLVFPPDTDTPQLAEGGAQGSFFKNVYMVDIRRESIWKRSGKKKQKQERKQDKRSRGGRMGSIGHVLHETHHYGKEMNL